MTDQKNSSNSEINIKNEIQQIIDKTNELLQTNTEWKERYDEYLNKIDDPLNKNHKCRKLFNVPRPFVAYTNISTVSNGKCEYDLRYKGQSVATISFDKNNNVRIDSKYENNKKHFEFDIKLEKADWNSDEARKFRKAFKNLDTGIKTKSPEHALESFLLCLLADSIRNIQPVKLNDQFFQMPTPLKASNPDKCYSGYYGGGIDILARMKIKGVAANNSSRLVVFEVKDENKKSESVDTVILQATAYATFVANLLKQNPRWAVIFGFDKKNCPKEIFVATLVPKGETSASFEEMEFIACDDIKLIMHTLYVDENKHLSGSLTNIKLQ